MREYYNTSLRKRVSAEVLRYAGWIGTVAAASSSKADQSAGSAPSLKDAGKRLAAIAGTSTCHIAQSGDGILVPGVVSTSRHVLWCDAELCSGDHTETRYSLASG